MLVAFMGDFQVLDFVFGMGIGLFGEGMGAMIIVGRTA